MIFFSGYDKIDFPVFIIPLVITFLISGITLYVLRQKRLI
jgi:hypothetical protein